jgi:large subunit ribosomal protein L41
MTPFVGQSTETTRQTDQGYESYPKNFTGKDYLKAWKLSGGHDVVETGDAKAYRNMPAPFEEKAGSKS